MLMKLIRQRSGGWITKGSSSAVSCESFDLARRMTNLRNASVKQHRAVHFQQSRKVSFWLGFGFMAKDLTMPKTYLFLGLFFGLVCLFANAAAQIAEITPKEPRWGDTLQVVYNPQVDSAKFLPGDEINVVYHVFWADSSQQKNAKMKKVGPIFQFRMPVTEDLAYLTFYFVTASHWDPNAVVSTLIRRLDGSPARGANLHTMLSPFLTENYLDCFYQEMEHHPKNYAAYRDKWFAQSAFDPARLKGIIEHELPLLEKTTADDSLGLLYSLSYGYMRLGKEKKSREVLRKLVERYPLSYYTGRAIEDYESLTFSGQIKGDGPKRVQQMKWKLVQNHPQTQFARQTGSQLANQKEIPLPTVEAVCELWQKAEPDNPAPFFFLANANWERRQKLSQAAELIHQAIDLLLQGKSRLYQDVSGKLWETMLSDYYALSADIHFQLGNHVKALGDIVTAQSVLQEPRADHQLKEAAIWNQVGDRAKAEMHFLQAVRFGSKEAKDSLKALYQQRYLTSKGFDEYLKLATQNRNAVAAGEKKPAPDFDVTALDGKRLRLADLHGKVVALNFWYVGCAPFKIEIPALNRLTKDLKKDSVVFIAFALNNETELKGFLVKNPFKYSIVPNAKEIAKRFAVVNYPTHIILNRDGGIEFTLTGGGANRSEQLRPLIMEALK